MNAERYLMRRNQNNAIKCYLIFSIIAVFHLTSLANPCQDSLYIELKKKDINSLTQNELTYMLSKDQQCVEIKNEVQMKSEGEKTRKKIASTILMSILAITVGVSILVFVFRNNG